MSCFEELIQKATPGVQDPIGEHRTSSVAQGLLPFWKAT